LSISARRPSERGRVFCANFEFGVPEPNAGRPRKELGYVEGKNIIIEQRFADCRYDRMPGLAADLVQVPVDVLFTMGTRAARIVAATVKTTPLVVYSCDPFEHVTRLARQGGNLTGVTCMTTELSPKRLELLKELVPNASRVMFLHDPEAAPNALKLTEEAAPRLGVSLQVAPVGAADELLPELTMIAKEQPDALFVYPDVVLSSHPRPQQLADFAIKAHLPTMHAFRFFVDAGGLMSYGRPNPRFIRPRLSRSQKSWMALGRVTCRCDRQRGSSWSSTTRLRRRSDSQFQRRCCCEPTR
jgi:putative ABC transport system substrate-binding protein